MFSLLKNRKHQDVQQLVIPNIVISLTDFQISMHDTVIDILLGSYPLQIFDVETESLRIETAISLQRNWLSNILRIEVNNNMYIYVTYIILKQPSWDD